MSYFVYSVPSSLTLFNGIVRAFLFGLLYSSFAKKMTFQSSLEEKGRIYSFVTCPIFKTQIKRMKYQLKWMSIKDYAISKQNDSQAHKSLVNIFFWWLKWMLQLKVQLSSEYFREKKPFRLGVGTQSINYKNKQVL